MISPPIEQKIPVDHVHFADVFKHLAQQWNMPEDWIELDCDVSTLKLPADIGKGNFTGINWDTGLGLLTFEGVFAKDTYWEFGHVAPQPLYVLIFQKGKMILSHNQLEDPITLRPSQSVLFVGGESPYTRIHFSAQEETQFSILQIDRIRFYELAQCKPEEVPASFAKVIHDRMGNEPYLYIGNFGYALHTLQDEVLQNPYQGLARKSFFLAKSMEIFAKTLAQFNKVENPDKPNHFLVRKADLETLARLISQIKNRLHEDLRIPLLAKEAHMSVSKFKMTFKTLTNQPVSSYIRELRLARARFLLLSTDDNIVNIAQRVGYSNAGHFSKRFRERYGVLPKEMRGYAVKHP